MTIIEGIHNGNEILSVCRIALIVGDVLLAILIMQVKHIISKLNK